MPDAPPDDERDSEGYYRCRAGCGLVYKTKATRNRLLSDDIALVIPFYKPKYRNLPPTPPPRGGGYPPRGRRLSEKKRKRKMGWGVGLPSKNPSPIYDQKGCKTIPCGAAHSYIAHIRENPPTHGDCTPV